MILELANGFHDVVAAMSREHPKHRALEVLEEATHRDVRFIARDPTRYSSPRGRVAGLRLPRGSDALRGAPSWLAEAIGVAPAGALAAYPYSLEIAGWPAAARTTFSLTNETEPPMTYYQT